MAKRTDQILEAVVALPVALVFERDIAGTTENVNVGGLPLELVMPALADSENGVGVIVPPTIDGVRDDVDWSEALGDDRPWASPTAWKGGQSAAAVVQIAVSHVLLRAHFETQPEPAGSLTAMSDTLFGSIDAWLATLMDWLEVAIGRALTSGGPTAHQEGHGVRAWGYDGTKYRELSSSVPIRVIVEMSDPLERAIWERALAATSTGKQIPTEYQFLRDARRALRGPDYRRAVVDAATAAEIAMTALLDAELASSTKVAATLVRKKWQQISGLAQALKEFGVMLPKDIRNTGLAEPRNKAMHAGQAPTREQAARALAIAAEVVELATPLNGLL